ncbi:uncharacterized protein IL334_007857 [Kwoniella shivajii]|uniref:Enoyl reductase (ER) domain-containing protein n=1 Tax=Kwoniella shivajii TaxID=564305 RepID=A0ABZ1DAP5_9TREE|nr:hypothetical protein IL334_007857 [Kwoniella shivajii]
MSDESTLTRPISTLTSTSNRKRTASTSEKKHSGRRTASGSASGSSANKEGYGGKASSDSFGDSGRVMNGEENSWASHTRTTGVEKAPSLDVDIRNSLILPSLSKQFSVLLPSLSTAPEESLRSLLASQRARHNGPALTEEEEELLFAEIRDVAQDEWDGRPPQMNENWARANSQLSPTQGRFGGLSTSYSSPSLLTTSTSSPSIPSMSKADGNNGQSSSGGFPSSPPPTSNSFSSFQTFGVASSPDTPTHALPPASGFKTKSYGFSGGTSMREAEYIRKMKKSTSHKDLKHSSGSLSSRRSEKSTGTTSENGTPTRDNIPLPKPISPEKANAYYQPTKRTESPTASERTATSTSSVRPNVSSKPKHVKSHSFSSAFSPPTPDSGESQSFPNSSKQQKSKKRQSRLAGLTPAQVKRISMALEEIGGKLKTGSMAVQAAPTSNERTNQQTVDDVEEILDSESRKASQARDDDDDIDRHRTPSDLRSEESCPSATSSVFPFNMSPTNSTFTGTNTEPSSPSRLPPSPRTHNLLAHVEEPLPSIPMPVFTPTRSQPVRHQPSLSNSSTKTVSSNQPVYIPGQPRPVRLTHHSQSSTSSRSAIPNNQSPLDAIRSAVSPENTPSPLSGMPGIAARTTSLERSRSLNQAQVTPTRPGMSITVQEDNVTESYTRRRVGTLGESPMSRRLSSSQNSNPSTPDIDMIQEADEPTSDQDDYSSRERSEEDILPQVKQVVGRRNVANSRSTSEASVHQLHHNLGFGLVPGQEPFERAVSAQGMIDESTPSTSAQTTAPQSPTLTLRRETSSTSIDSDFSEASKFPNDFIWENILENGTADIDTLEVNTSTPSQMGRDVEILRKMSGIGLEDMMLLQEKLVNKAKAEREALRGDVESSPTVSYSPAMSAEYFSPNQQMPLPTRNATSPIVERPISPPPSSWRFPHIETQQSSSHSTTPSQDKTTLPSSVDTHILTPPLTGGSIGDNVSRSVSKSSQMMFPTRPAPPPPSQQHNETPSEIADDIQTPPSADLSRKSSSRAHYRLPLEHDPDVRRDFEARIAAATAALNRTPSIQGNNSKLERKFTKKGGPMVISSPKLVSSTANVPTTPLTPENQVDQGPSKSVEKSASGSGSKMSLKWKKFAGLRNKGPSVSGSEVASIQSNEKKLSPKKQLQQQQQHQQLAQQNKLSPPEQPTQSGLQRSASASAARKLEEPISLKQSDLQGPPSAPPNLDAFRFPPPPERSGPPPSTAPKQKDIPSPPSSIGHSNGLKHVISKMKRSKETSPNKMSDGTVTITGNLEGRAQSPVSSQEKATSPMTTIESVAQSKEKQTPTSLDEDTRNKFIEAGRALGLSEEQLNLMLAAKGMDGTSTAQPDATSVTAVPNPASHEEKSIKPEKEKKGLFRSLSKARKAQPSPSPALAPAAPIPESSTPQPVHDKVVVRRTMILPEGLNIIPSTPQAASTTPRLPESPESSLRPGQGIQQRKQSIRRKPLQLSKEDHELVVSNSPPAHRRNFSFSHGSSKSVSDSGGNTPTIPNGSGVNGSSSQSAIGDLRGLGFLHPHTPSNNKSGSASGSAQSLSPSPGDSFNDNESHARSSTGGSLIDMYGNQDDEEMLESPQKRSTSNDMHDYERRTSEDKIPNQLDRRRMTQAVEITEYADGQVVWNIVDALRTSVAGSVDGEEYTFDAPRPHSRTTSYTSSLRKSVINENEDVFQMAGSSAGWPRGPNGTSFNAGTQGLNLRHRDRDGPQKPRPPTDVYFTSSRDVADLIDHLSRDLDASHGRIDIISHSPDGAEWPPSSSSPFVYPNQDTTAIPTPTTPERSRSPNPQFEDAPSPAATRLTPSFISPGRHLFADQSQSQLHHNRGQSFISVGTHSPSQAGMSPSSKSFASSVSGQGKSVEDRLQALLDRLKDSGIGGTVN